MMSAVDEMHGYRDGTEQEGLREPGWFERSSWAMEAWRGAKERYRDDRARLGLPWLPNENAHRLDLEQATTAPERRCTVIRAVTALVGVRIYTCGSDVCVFRATHHGVPGAVYPSVTDGPRTTTEVT